VRFAGNVGVGGAAAAAAADFGSWPTFASANSAAPHRRPAYQRPDSLSKGPTFRVGHIVFRVRYIYWDRDTLI